MRILWLKTELLHPVDKGGRIRTYQMLRELRRRHHITYLTLDDGRSSDEAELRAEEYCDELVRIPFRSSEKFSAGFWLETGLSLFSPRPYAIQKYKTAAMSREIRRRVGNGDTDVLVCDFLAPSVNMPAVIPCASVLFQHNVEAQIWQRHFQVQENRLKKAFLRRQWQRMLAYEREVCRRFDHVVAVSPQDRELMRREYGLEAITDIPTGVDTEYFRPSGTASVDPNLLVFTGSMDWMPNEDAIRYFLERVMPLIRRDVPEAGLMIVGRKPSRGLMRLADEYEGLQVTGYVDDVRPYVERAAGFIVPLRVGGGTRLKIYEAMAMETPVVSTSVGAEGLSVRHGRELLVADGPEDFARATVRLLRDRDFARKMARAAAEKVRAEFSWDRVAQRFEVICEGCLRKRYGTAGTTERSAVGEVVRGDGSVTRAGGETPRLPSVQSYKP